MICLSRWCFMVLYGAVCLNCRFSLKKRSLSKLTYKAKQAEKAVKGLQTMIRKLERMLAGRNRLKEIDEALASGKITLDRYCEGAGTGTDNKGCGEGPFCYTAIS